MPNFILYFLIISLVVSLIAAFGYYALWTNLKKDAAYFEKEAEISRQNAHRYYLNVIRREFSAQITSKDRVLFRELERKAHSIERQVSKMSNKEFEMEINLMRNKYPHIMDFDFIGENDGQYFSYFEYNDIYQIFWEEWDDSGQKLEDDWSRHEYNRNTIRENYLDIVKYSALIIRFVRTIHFPDEEFNSDISTGTDKDKMVEVWEEKHGPYYGRKSAQLKS